MLFLTESEIGEAFIYTVAFTKNQDSNFLSNCFEFERSDFETQHSQTYQKVLKAFAYKLKLPVAQLKIEKNSQGIPQLFWDEIKSIEELIVESSSYYKQRAKLASVKALPSTY